jgi:hypothetical protein
MLSMVTHVRNLLRLQNENLPRLYTQADGQGRSLPSWLAGILVVPLNSEKKRLGDTQRLTLDVQPATLPYTLYVARASALDLRFLRSNWVQIEQGSQQGDAFPH